MTPITPNDMSDSFFASSSMFNCSGVRFSSTYRPIPGVSTDIHSPHRGIDNETPRTSCIIEKMTPNSVEVPVAMTTPVPRPIKKYTSLFNEIYPIMNSGGRTVSDQSAHVRDTSPVREGHGVAGRAALGVLEAARLVVLPPGLRLTRETALVDLEVDGEDDTDVRRDTVTRREGDNVAWYEFVRENMD